MRKNYIDNIKWMTQIIVVLYHVLLMYNAQGLLGGVGKITKLDVQYYDILLYIPFPWAMALLFLVSGIATKHYLDRDSDAALLKSRTIKLLLPSTIGIAVFWFMQGYINMKIIGNWTDVKSLPLPFLYLIMAINGIGVLWFIQVLWLDSVLLILIRKIEKGRLLELGKRTNTLVILLFTFLIWGAMQVLNGKTLVVYRLGLYTVSFLLGYFVFSHDEVMNRVKKFMPLYVVVAVVLGIIFCIKYWGADCSDPAINCSLLFGCYCWFGCLGVLSFMACFGNYSNSITKYFSKISYGIYLCHYTFVSAIALYIVKPGYISGAPAYIITIIGGFIGGYLLYELIIKIPVVRILLAGETAHKSSNVA